jgi:hypothetical protein
MPGKRRRSAAAAASFPPRSKDSRISHRRSFEAGSFRALNRAVGEHVHPMDNESLAPRSSAGACVAGFRSARKPASFDLTAPAVPLGTLAGSCPGLRAVYARASVAQSPASPERSAAARPAPCRCAPAPCHPQGSPLLPRTSAEQRVKLSIAQRAYVANDPPWPEYCRKLVAAQEARRMTRFDNEVAAIVAVRKKHFLVYRGGDWCLPRRDQPGVAGAWCSDRPHQSRPIGAPRPRLRDLCPPLP